jgi:hypothetical protein
LEHRYFETDLTDEPVDRLFDRFIANGEGRIDHVSGYADGFRLWSQLVEANIQGIVRGDQAFGAKPVRTTQEARERAGLTLWEDFGSLPRLEDFGLSTPIIPEALQQISDESLAMWRDRLFQQYRVPFVHGALSDLKLPYVEIISPLLSDSLINLVRQLPDSLRTGKSLLMRITLGMGPDIPFAEGIAIQGLGDILTLPRVVEFLRDNLSTRSIRDVVPIALAAYAVAGLVSSQSSRSREQLRRARRIVKSITPTWIRTMRSQATHRPSLHRNHLAFRILLIERSVQLYTKDASSIQWSDSTAFDGLVR